jgi:HAD superfamily hydrolase (TIGR01450 family)
VPETPPQTLKSPPDPLDLSQYAAVLLDLDGTVYHEDHALPGAVELIRRLQAEGRPYACLTNSTSSPERLTVRLRRMGVEVDPAHIYTAAAATADYVVEHFGCGADSLPRVFNLSTEGVQEMLEGKVRWVQNPSEPCDVVICGVPLNVFATEERQRSAMLLLRQGAALVGICADRVYPSPRGLEFGVGAMAAMLAYAAGVTPVFCGKPEKIFFHELCARLGVEPHRCVLIGDNLESDIAGGKGIGMRTVLCLSGVHRREDAERLPPERRPDAIIGDLREVLR